MKFLNLQTNCGITSIQLLDNEFVDFWLEHFQKVIKYYDIEIIITSQPVLRHYISIDEKEKLINNIISTIDEINSLDYIIPFPESFVKEQFLPLDLTSQLVLNKLHRYCVVGEQFRNRWIYDSDPMFAYIRSGNISQFRYLLNLLNQSIHVLEQYVSTPNKLKFQNSIYNMQLCLANSSKYSDVNVYADGIDLAIPDSMQKHMRLTGYDVWIKKDILGKDFITAFSEHESPSNFDIQPPPMISGGILIDMNIGRSQLFNSQYFKDWLGKDPDDTQGSYPLGNIVSGKNFLSKAKKISINISHTDN
jgi:hypothetical protein